MIYIISNIFGSYEEYLHTFLIIHKVTILISEKKELYKLTKSHFRFFQTNTAPMFSFYGTYLKVVFKVRTGSDDIIKKNHILENTFRKILRLEKSSFCFLKILLLKLTKGSKYNIHYSVLINICYKCD